LATIGRSGVVPTYGAPPRGFCAEEPLAQAVALRVETNTAFRLGLRPRHSRPLLLPSRNARFVRGSCSSEPRP